MSASASPSTGRRQRAGVALRLRSRARGGRWPRPDFLAARSPRSTIGWALLAAGALVAAVAAADLVDVRAQRDAAADRVAALERQRRAQAQVQHGADAPSSALPPQALPLLQSVASRLGRRWGDALVSIEQSGGTAVRWLELDIDGDPARVRVEGLAPGIDEVLAVVDALAARAGWADVTLTRTQSAKASGAAAATPLRFEVTARLPDAGQTHDTERGAR